MSYDYKSSNYSPYNSSSYSSNSLFEFDYSACANLSFDDKASLQQRFDADKPRARGRKGGAPLKMTTTKLKLAMSAMGKPETMIGELCKELGITRQTLYRHIAPDGSLREDGKKILVPH
jgi:hypothetical protein